MKRVLLFVGVILLTGCTQSTTGSSQGQPQLPMKDLRLISPSGATLIVHAEIASTPSQQEQGLMFRTKIDPDSGMLFPFSQSQRLNFWMKNTIIPMDVLFFDASGSFVSFATMSPCTHDPCTIYSSRGEAAAALEVAPGFTTSHGIAAGWQIKIP